ncbi:hypothetical protein [Bradyrhizobium macuxiense]|uniref:hypothetical protein n=1 Tax=Bradyrhizobium macuxiense TaxID=1755647 RepID=UPI00142ECFDD|nr:hypothetical protein [Bradyrhizobium macuxiense]
MIYTTNAYAANAVEALHRSLLSAGHGSGESIRALAGENKLWLTLHDELLAIGPMFIE